MRGFSTVKRPNKTIKPCTSVLDEKQAKNEAARVCFKRARVDTKKHHQLGLKYYKGVDQDFTKARECFAKAAEQGHNDAQNKLGVLYELRKGVPQDLTKAREWYKKAAEQGYDRAIKALNKLNKT